jgi:hypothetical protein
LEYRLICRRKPDLRQAIQQSSCHKGSDDGAGTRACDAVGRKPGGVQTIDHPGVKGSTPGAALECQTEPHFLLVEAQFSRERPTRQYGIAFEIAHACLGKDFVVDVDAAKVLRRFFPRPRDGAGLPTSLGRVLN